ncbi:MAG: hypothetical protein KKA54_14355 [Proteobacteria bacterium]|nr:hypothetical protein [Pseudomonadota bacterium]
MMIFHDKRIRDLKRKVKLLFALSLALVFLLPATVYSADRLYFVSMVEHDVFSGDPQVLLEWGPLEGNIPSGIKAFRLYRQTDSGPFVLLDEISYVPATPAGILDIILGDNDERRRADLLNVLNDVSSAQTPPGPDITEDNFHFFLSELLDPASKNYNPLQRMLLIRYHPGVARASGLAFLDRDVVVTSKYVYMLTAITDKDESLPIGKSSTVLPADPTLLPAPTGLRQVRVADCSSIKKNLDDLRIHFNWDVPVDPQDISLKVLAYGYDLFWAEKDMGTVDLRQGIPVGLHKVNTKPIVVAGPAPATGADSYLARDSEENHASGPSWQRGQHFFYYLATRDMAGHYSMTGGPLEGVVVDTQPPAAPWRLHTEELSQIVEGHATPRLALVWDQVNPINYIRYFGTDRAICSSDDKQVCTAPSEAACVNEAAIQCTDLDVIKYHIFRFLSPADAASWGTDSDGDMWPDNLEKEAGTDACDPAQMPHNSPPARLIATLDQYDDAFQRSLADKHRQMYYVDTDLDVNDYNRVYYYRILAEDPAGNFSPLSPPIRGVLYDRTQPVVEAGMKALDCGNYFAEQQMTELYREPDDILTLVDKTGKAGRFIFRRLCVGGSTYIPDETVLSGRMENGFAHITAASLADGECESTGCSGGFVTGYKVLFYDERNLPMTEASVVLNMAGLCAAYHGAVILDGLCLWTDITPGMVASGPVQVCAGLEEGETARVYYETGGEMSPVATIPYNPDPDNNGQSCIEVADMAGLVTSDLCMGVRVFSENHVGSGMYYFNCLEMMPAAGGAMPPPPIVEGLYSKENAEAEPYFDLRWSAPAEGQAAFVIALKSENTTRYQTIFPKPADTSGQFSTSLMLNGVNDLDKEWCVRLRAISTSMQSSPWSQETCATWTSAEPENLAWPRMQEPVETGSITAFFMNEQPGFGRPALVLSSDVSPLLTAIPCDDGVSCLSKVPVCDGTDVCVKKILEDDQWYDEPVNFKNKLACNYIEPMIAAKNFVLYRQEEGKDFVQVSPLVKDFTCDKYTFLSGGGSTIGEWVTYYQVRDPFYFLRHFEANAVGGVEGTTGVAIDPAVATGTRMIFLDRYPYVYTSTIRYKIVFFDPETGEPKTIRTSNWLTLP